MKCSIPKSMRTKYFAAPCFAYATTRLEWSSPSWWWWAVPSKNIGKNSTIFSLANENNIIFEKTEKTQINFWVETHFPRVCYLSGKGF